MLALEHVAVSPRSRQLERIDLDRSHNSPILTAVSALADWSEPEEGDKGRSAPISLLDPRGDLVVVH